MDYTQKLIAMLNYAYIYEHQAFRSYIHAVVSTTGPLHDLYEKLYKELADKEREHMYEVGEKITALGGKVSTKCLPIDNVAAAVEKGYDETLAELQKGEDKALSIYKKIHEYTTENDDLTTALLIEHIIEEEQEHHDELQRVLMDGVKDEPVEMHDKLVVDAFDERADKLAGLFGDK